MVDFRQLMYQADEERKLGKILKTLDKEGIRVGSMGQVPSDPSIWLTTLNKNSQTGIGQAKTAADSVIAAYESLMRRGERPQEEKIPWGLAAELETNVKELNRRFQEWISSLRK